MSAKTEVLGALSIKYTGESPPEGKNGKKVKSGVCISLLCSAVMTDMSALLVLESVGCGTYNNGPFLEPS